MPQVDIRLPVDLTTQHRRIVLKYFEKTQRLSPQEWKAALQAFDMLKKGTVEIGRGNASAENCL